MRVTRHLDDVEKWPSQTWTPLLQDGDGRVDRILILVAEAIPPVVEIEGVLDVPCPLSIIMYAL